MTETFADESAIMRRAIELAAQGVGFVEPNPAVGAVIVDDQGRALGEGYHAAYGGPHAEVHALKHAGTRARGSTLFVTLEPCRHQGKTGPCTRAVIDAGIKRIIVGLLDPSPHCAGQGVAELRAAGIAVEVGLLEREVRRLTAPFLKLIETGLPYVHAKWAMTLDGKIATRSGSSRWISNERSRELVHRLRGRMDAIIIGAGTARRDDPLLTARPPGPRTATRIVLNAQADLSVGSQLVRTADQAPVLVATSQSAREDQVRRLHACGVEVLPLPEVDIPDSIPRRRGLDLRALLVELGRRRMTNALIEGGPTVLGAALDGQLIDEVHVFLAPKLFGGAAPSAVAGLGIGDVKQAASLDDAKIEIVDGDVYIHGRVRYRETPQVQSAKT